jgi:hypothetical protein
MVASIAELDTQPQRIFQIRQNNIIQSLRRHDWVYRWRQTLDCVGVPTTTRLAEREERLDRVATAVECGRAGQAAIRRM